jgi:hypothetical protein
MVEALHYVPEDDQKKRYNSIDEYRKKYGDSSQEARGNLGLQRGRALERILGTPDIESIDNEAEKKGLIMKKRFDDGKEFSVIKKRYAQNGRKELDLDAVEEYFKIVMKHQEGDPVNPEAQFANDLRIEILDQLNLDEDAVKYYSSVGTALDTTKDIRADAFFDIAGSIFTFDITAREEKSDLELDSDILITEDDISMVNEIGLTLKEDSKAERERKKLAEQAYLIQIEKVARKFVEVYQQRQVNVA